MPLRFDIEKYLGTNSDGSRSDEYCYYCLKDGKYIVDIPMSEMINIWIKYTDKYNEYADTAYSPKELRRILNERLPKLNRWKQKLETSNIHHQKIQDIVVYINNHLFDSLDADILNSLTTAERAQYKAEAKIFRAMVMFDMVRLWGDFPVITTVADDITSENIDEVYPQYFPKQNTELEAYQQIEKDLLDAVLYAPDNTPGNKTLFSKSVARTLLAKIYAEKPLRDYTKVIQYCDEVKADGFDLVDDFSDLFGMNAAGTDAKMRNTKESILEAQFTSGAGNWCTWMFGRDLVNWNNNFTWAKWVTPSRDLISAFKQEGDEVRFKESIVYYDCNWSNYYPSDNYPFMYKCRSANSSIIKYRYADVLLLKAEALIMQDTPDLEGAADIIDEVRDRAKLGALPTSVRSNKNAMLNALLKERRLELAFEGQRWFDLVRLDKVEEVMNAVYSKDSGRKAQIYTFDKNSYRLPIPQSVIDANDKIHQNPGY